MFESLIDTLSYLLSILRRVDFRIKILHRGK